MTFTRFACLAAVPLFLGGAAMAQVFPTRAEGPVTDDALLIADDGEAALASRLASLREAGTAFEVVTLPNMNFYTMGTDVPTYANLLAENFGLTAAAEGKWALMLVFPEERELRIATGPAYAGREADISAIAAEVITPAFQTNTYDSGITQGVDALVSRVLAPEAATPDSGGNGLYWLLGGLVVAVGGIVALVKRGNAKFALQPCKACGKTGLTRERVTLVAPTMKTEGRGESRITCPSCGHVEASAYTIAKLQAQSRKQDGAASRSAGAAVVGGAAEHGAQGLQLAATTGKSGHVTPPAQTKPGMQGHKDHRDKVAAPEAATDETQGGGASARW